MEEDEERITVVDKVKVSKIKMEDGELFCEFTVLKSHKEIVPKMKSIDFEEKKTLSDKIYPDLPNPSGKLINSQLQSKY